MQFGKRIKTIYAKELVEILRDRRTLIAMIVVPIALYPLLIVGSVQLLSIQGTERRIERIRIAVPPASEPADAEDTHTIVVTALQEAKRIFSTDNDAEHKKENEQRIHSIEQMEVVPVKDVEGAVASGQYVVGIKIEKRPEASGFFQWVVKPYYDSAEIRSESALERVREVFEVVNRKQQNYLLEAFHTPRFVLEPIVIEPVNVATPRKVGGMVLGTIVPLVLVLMTITGAIYPAIDLTAGERERGTLETLIVAPVPPMELITGKYLVVTTIALLGAALNLLSVGATLYLGGFTEIIGAAARTELPLGVLPVILVALIPFALLFSALMVAVCSYARTFKEAQNYIMPVILAALIPGGVAALPGTEMTTVNALVPVMNMVLLARELLLGHWDLGIIALVVFSTSLYAATAVTIASRVFSTESVVFADSASLKATFARRLIRPSKLPSVSMALIVTAILFPTWMFVQVSIQPAGGGGIRDTFEATAKLMPVFFVVIPIAILWYWRVKIFRSLSLRRPRLRYVAGAILIGAAVWIPGHELLVLQNAVIPIPKVVLQSGKQMGEAFAGTGLWLPLLLIAIVPAACEELYFRGFLFSGLRSGARKWTVIIVAACVFAVFHMLLSRFAYTAGVGVLLGFLCWQSRSIWPSMIAHMLHNSTILLIAFWPPYSRTLGVSDSDELAGLPPYLIALGIGVVILGIALCLRPDRSDDTFTPEGGMREFSMPDADARGSGPRAGNDPEKVAEVGGGSGPSVGREPGV